MTNSTALLLIAHGSKRDEANADLPFVADALRRRGPYTLIECCYLELAEPDIEAGGDQCVALGAKRVLMVPYFLSSGMHVCEDLEAARSELAAKHPAVEFRLCEPLGRHPLIIEVIAQRAEQAEK